VVRRAYFSLGSNVGDRGHYLALGVAVVAGEERYRLSPVYETEPVGGVAQDDFWNLVLEVTTDASAHELLGRAQRAESEAGRTREVHWGPRTLDVDVLLVGDERVDDATLQVPHPRLFERSFVLVPLADLAPELVSDEQLRAGVGAVRKLGTLKSLH